MNNLNVVWLPITCKQGINPNSSSARIRGRWIFDKIPYCKNGRTNPFKFEDTNILIFQKWCDNRAFDVMVNAKSKGCKIVLDLCDPVWLNECEQEFKLFVSHCNAITFSTESLLSAFKEKFPDITCTLKHIPDRHDMNEIGKPLIKEINPVNEEKVIIWQGHQNNVVLVRKLMDKIMSACELIKGLKFKIIQEKEPTTKHYGDNVIFDKWSEDTIYDIIRSADLVLNPKCSFGDFKYESDNKTTLGLCLGTKVIDMDVFSDSWTDEIVNQLTNEPLNLEQVLEHRKNNDVWGSVKEWEELLKTL